MMENLMTRLYPIWKLIRNRNDVICLSKSLAVSSAHCAVLCLSELGKSGSKVVIHIHEVRGWTYRDVFYQESMAFLSKIWQPNYTITTVKMLGPLPLGSLLQ